MDIANFRCLDRSSAASRPNSTPQRVWRPTFGIIFNNNAASSPRSLTTVTATDIEQDLLLHANAEDLYVLNSSVTSATRLSAVATPEKAPDTKPEDEALSEDPEQNELPRSTTTYKMSLEEFLKAKEAGPEEPESYWSHTLYRGPEVDGAKPKVKVHYCQSKHTTERVCQEYFQNEKLLGFDIEWKPDSTKHHGPKKNVSLIQLASEERIALFHIALYPGDKLEDLVAPTLKKIMEDSSITKVGVAIKADCTRLRKFLNIDSKGLFELSHLYKLIKYTSSNETKLVNKRLVSLAVQVQDHLHLPLFKGEVRGSDWSLPKPLKMDQIIYAAADSYAGIHLYDTMEIKRKALDPTPPRPYLVEENKPIRLAEGVEIAIEDEVDVEEAESTITTKKSMPGPKFSSSYLASASETLVLDPDFEASPEETLTATRTNTRASKASIQPTHPLVVTAGLQADAYRDTHHQNRAAPPSLRCYFLWHDNSDLSIEDIAALLREAPLAKSTVVNYILDAVKLEKLHFDTERLADVLAFIPKEAQGRYRTLVTACNKNDRNPSELIEHGGSSENKRWKV